MPASSFTHPLADLLQQRIVIIDGAMGTTIQQYKLTEEQFRGERFRGLDRARISRATTSCSTSRSRRSSRKSTGAISRRARTSWRRTPSTGSSFRSATTAWKRSPTSFRCAGAECARRAADAVMAAQPGRQMLRRRCDRADHEDIVDFHRRERRLRARDDLGRTGARLRRAGARAARWRRGHPARRDDLRHAERQGGVLRDRGDLRRARADARCRSAKTPEPGKRVGAADGLGDVHPEGRHARRDRPDGRGVLEFHLACAAAQRRHELRARAGGNAPADRGTVAASRRST